MLLIKNSVLLTPLRQEHDRIVAVEGGRIAGIHDRLDPPESSETIDAHGLYLSPGLIDLHVHGGGGYGVMSGDPKSILKMCEAHARCGTTSILPTTLASPIPKLMQVIDAVKSAQQSCSVSNILGIHLEGPFLSKAQRGAQSEDDILVPAEHDYRELLEAWNGIKIMGAAPETRGGMELGRELRKRDILASVAHSDATYDQMVEAISCGYSDVTHIYSGCSSVIRKNGYRIAGVVEAGLLRDELTVQVIADLKHLPPALLKLIYKCKGPDRITLITDGLEYAASDLKEGTVYRQENGVDTVYEDGVMKLLDRQAFAGSVATSARLVKNMYLHADVPLIDAVKMATMTPARLAGVNAHKGCIAPGYDADLILFDRDVKVKMVMVAGKVIFNYLR